MIFIFYYQVFMLFLLGNVEDFWEWVKVRMWFNMIDVQYYELIIYFGKYIFKLKKKIMQIFLLEICSMII